MSKKAVVLLSGGLDSATVLAFAKREGFECYALSFDYGQRHSAELRAAEKMATLLGAFQHKFVKLGLDAIGGSALTDASIEVPDQFIEGVIPVTYVPARNTVFLAFALGWAEVIGATDLFIGVNAVDYSGYPDCRPQFISAFESLANLATKAGVEGAQFRIHTPLISLSKGEIIRLGNELDVPYEETVSCYSANASGLACGVCDACRLRRAGFETACLPDPTRYESDIQASSALKK